MSRLIGNNIVHAPEIWFLLLLLCRNDVLFLSINKENVRVC